MRELRDGLWHWQAPHPEWTPEERWPQVVSSAAIDDGTRLLLIDPLAVPQELLARAAERETAILLTAPWHERDARSLVERLGVPVYSPPADTAEDLIRKHGITREQAGDGSPDLNWLRGADAAAYRPYAAGDPLPCGIEALVGRETNDVVLWVDRLGAVISGDTLVDFGQGFEINRSLRDAVTHEEVADRLRPLLDRPVDVVLSAHGAPTDRAALERALA